MGLAQENFVKEFCAAWGDGTFETKPNVEKILSMMSHDAE
jgi:limonene-1,2-epoxide hydrolase